MMPKLTYLISILPPPLGMPRKIQVKNREFLLRIISGVVLGAITAWTIYDGGMYFTGIVCLASYQVCQEYFGFIDSKRRSLGQPTIPKYLSVCVGIICAAIAAFTFFSNGKAAAILVVAVFSTLSFQLWTSEVGLSDLAITVFCIFYCGYLPSYWIRLRLLTGPLPVPGSSWAAALLPTSRYNLGFLATLLSLSCIVASDTGAFFFGRHLGRIKLHKNSPKKTVEGAIGGLVCSISNAFIFSWAFGWPNPVVAAILGVLLFVASLFGDLLESGMKRDAGMKDAGSLIPGHGGLLDRIDSVAWCGALVYFA